jgi:hypothetical protein
VPTKRAYFLAYHLERPKPARVENRASLPVDGVARKEGAE